MPYIKQQDRIHLDFHIEETVKAIKRISPEVIARPGTSNYVVTRIVASALKPSTGWDYHSISRALAVLRDAECEMRRRLMDCYEQYKSSGQQNGDIIEYERPFE